MKLRRPSLPVFLRVPREGRSAQNRGRGGGSFKDVEGVVCVFVAVTGCKLEMAERASVGAADGAALTPTCFGARNVDGRRARTVKCRPLSRKLSSGQSVRGPPSSPPCPNPNSPIRAVALQRVSVPQLHGVVLLHHIPRSVHDALGGLVREGVADELGADEVEAGGAEGGHSGPHEEARACHHLLPGG